MYAVIGRINIVLIIIMTGPFWMSFLSRHNILQKNSTYVKIFKYFRKIHKPLGLTLIILGLIHGYLALGGLKIHTGSILWFFLLITAVLGGAFYKTKKKHFFMFHKRMALATVIMLLIHLIIPGATYQLFS